MEALNPVRTIEEQFKELLLFHNVCKESEVKNIALDKMKDLRIPNVEKVLESLPFELSGGMCQRVSIAMCLCLSPKLLIADEPTSALDVLSAERVIKNLKNIGDTSLLLITHDISVASKLADKTIILNKGKISEEGDNKKIIESEDPYTQSLINSYREIPKLKSEFTEGEEILRAEDIYKAYGSHKVVDGVSFSMYEGEIFGIIGESGCRRGQNISPCIEFSSHQRLESIALNYNKLYLILQ